MESGRGDVKEQRRYFYFLFSKRREGERKREEQQRKEKGKAVKIRSTKFATSAKKKWAKNKEWRDIWYSAAVQVEEGKWATENDSSMPRVRSRKSSSSGTSACAVEKSRPRLDP